MLHVRTFIKTINANVDCYNGPSPKRKEEKSLLTEAKTRTLLGTNKDHNIHCSQSS